MTKTMVTIKLEQSAKVAGKMRNRGWKGPTSQGEAALHIRSGVAVEVPAKPEKAEAETKIPAASK